MRRTFPFQQGEVGPVCRHLLIYPSHHFIDHVHSIECFFLYTNQALYQYGYTLQEDIETLTPSSSPDHEIPDQQSLSSSISNAVKESTSLQKF